MDGKFRWKLDNCIILFVQLFSLYICVCSFFSHVLYPYSISFLSILCVPESQISLIFPHNKRPAECTLMCVCVFVICCALYDFLFQIFCFVCFMASGDCTSRILELRLSSFGFIWASALVFIFLAWCVGITHAHRLITF